MFKGLLQPVSVLSSIYFITALEKPLPIGERISPRVPKQQIVPEDDGKRYHRKSVKWTAQAPLVMASQRLVAGNLHSLEKIS